MNVYATGLEGLQRAEAKLEKAATRVANFVGSLENPQDVVDLSQEAVAIMAAETGYKANLKSIETMTELQQSTIDLMG
jgi:flagellar basal body rod protein FlgC